MTHRDELSTTPGEAARALVAAAFHKFRGDDALTDPTVDLILETAERRPDVAVVLTELVRLTAALMHREAERAGTTLETWVADLLTREADREQRALTASKHQTRTPASTANSRKPPEGGRG